MPAFVTVTLNPALDLSTAVAHVVDAHKLRCEAPVVHPGGGGVNVARVLHRLGADVLALCTAGGPTGERLSRLLAGEGVAGLYLPIGGDTRESFSVRETSTGREYRFVLPGPTLTGLEWQNCLDRLRALPGHVRYLVASGSLPPGVPTDFYARLARLARDVGARLVLDTSGPALAEALAEGVWLVKPSLRELSELSGEALTSPQARLAAARSLVASGGAQWVALSLGPEGAQLVSARHALYAAALEVPVRSTIGAGDSFLAGLLSALDRHEDNGALALARGMAAAAAALSSPGTALCQSAAVDRLVAQVQVKSADTLV